MTSLRAAVAALLVLSLLAAGCGGDDDDDGDGDAGGEAAQTATQEQPAAGGGEPVGDRGGREAAEAFIACFDEEGYKATRQQTPSDVGALLAETEGYEVEPVFVESDRGALYGVFVSFFASEAQRERATRELDLDFGSADVPEADERGSAVVTYVAEPATEARSAIDRCLG